MFAWNKTTGGIIKQFTQMVKDLDEIIDDDTSQVGKVEEEIEARTFEKEVLLDDMKKAMKIRSNITTLIGGE